MSTFPGPMEEIPGISVDRFDNENLNSSAFFLSHCHSDHMEGLNYNFFDFLMRNNLFLYCSHISKSFLTNRFKLDSKFANKHIIELSLDDSRIVDYTCKNIQMSISVSCISAGHCPGSIMFLFYFNNKRILYTGDFRINKEDFSKLKPLHYNNVTQQIPLPIDKIYLDTTFLDLKYKTLPNRTDSLRELIKAAKNWIEKHPNNVVMLEKSALYGSEFIYIELSKVLNKKIHVQNNVFNVYSRMEILADHVTNIGESTPIHACMLKMESMTNTKGLKCKSNTTRENILTIVPSVRKWAGKDTSCIIELDEKRKQTANVCYSTHASYDELEAFIQYFKPKEIFASVCPQNDHKSIYALLEKIMRQDIVDEPLSKKSRITLSKQKTFTSSNFKSKFLSDDENDL